MGIAALFGGSPARAAFSAVGDQSTTSVGTIVTGTNLISAARVTTPAAPAGNVHGNETTSATWTPLTDGLLGNFNSDLAASVSPLNGTSVVFPLDTTASPKGYTITSFDTYSAWNDGGRDGQGYTLAYSTVAAPTTFITLGSITYNGVSPNPAAPTSTHVRMSNTLGYMASGVAAIQVTFANQENGWVGYREFKLLGSPTPDAPAVTVVNESNTTGVWTFPAGANLLATCSPNTPNAPAGYSRGNGDSTSQNWSTLWDGQLGPVTNFLQSVAPNNDTGVNLALDISTNFNGYNITSFDSYCTWGDTGRDNQDYTLLYSTVDNPTVFNPVTVVANHTSTTGVLSTHTRITPNSGFIATRVHSVRLYFANQENGYTGFRELILQGSAVPLASPITWSGLGNSNWIATADNNWKDSTSGTQVNFNPIAPVTFDSTGLNPNITLPTALTTSGITFANDNTKAYTFGGQTLTVSNAVISAGSGSATFNNSTIVLGGVSLTGSGSLVFGGAVQSSGLTVSGAGSLTLVTSNTITGGTSVSNGTLIVKDDAGLGLSPLVVTGGAVRFSSGSPSVSSLSGSGGSVILGDASTSSPSTLYVGDTTATAYSGVITNASPAAYGNLDKTGTGNLLLSGANTYTGITTIESGILEFTQRTALYNATTASWNSGNLQVYPTGVLGLRVGDTGEFTNADLALIGYDGFYSGSFLGLDTNTVDFQLTKALSGSLGLTKFGPKTLRIGVANTYTGSTNLFGGIMEPGNASGVSIPGNLVIGNGTADVWLNLVAPNQFAPGAVVSFSIGTNARNAKFQLRGNSQTIAGLDSAPANSYAIVQNDEAITPGFTTPSPAATLTIDAATDHSFAGYLRNLAATDSGVLNLVKNGTGTQELVNTAAGSIGYSGTTTVNNGTLKLNISNAGYGGFGSNVTLNTPGKLELTGVNHYFLRTITGTGKVVKSGSTTTILSNGANTYTGGTDINSGILVLDATPTGVDGGAGTGPNQGCVVGLMDPSNVVTVNNGASLVLAKTRSLGASTMLPQYGVSIVVKQGAHLQGNQGGAVFVPNLTLDGGIVDVGTGDATVNGLGTNLCFVGTVTVGGTSSTPAIINAPATADPTGNASLGSSGLPGTTFQVADVTASPAVDLTVTSVLRDIGTAASPLVKTGPGTMLISGANTYTGDTTVTAGTLAVTGTSIADSNKLILNGGKLDIAASANETVGTLYYGATQQVAGTYGSSSSSASFKDDTRFSGSGILTVTNSPITDPYLLWSAQISDPAQRGRTADPDHDGFTNEQEYLFGTSPTASTGSLSQIVQSGSNLVIQWNQLSTGTSTYVLKESTTLQAGSWTTSTLTITDNPTQNISGYTRKQAIAPVSGPRKFYRVEATE